MSDPVRLPPTLATQLARAQEEHVMELAKILMRHFPTGGSLGPRLLVADLEQLTAATLGALARESHEQGLATAGDARQAIDDLATLRAAAAILTGSR